MSEVSDKASSGYILPADQKVTIKTDETATVTMHNELRDTRKQATTLTSVLWVSLAAAFTVGAGIFGFAGYKSGKRKGGLNRMRKKTIIAIVLVVFIGGAAAWLHIRRKK